MFTNLIILTLSYLFVTFSLLGYGLLFERLFKKNHKIINLGFSGLYGILILLIYSYISNFFIPHSINHNFILILFGFILFVLLNVKNIHINYSKDNILTLIIALIILSSLLLAKNHDDFPYYHFPYTYYLTQESLHIGIGQFGHGFRTPSSIFYLNSLFYLPFVEYFSFNFGQAIIFCFANIILLKNINSFFINFKTNKTQLNYLNYLSLLAFIFINIFFYRISEHGTDRSAQILIFIFIIELLKFFYFKNKKNIDLSNIFLISILIISLKAFYIIYGIFFILILIFIFFIKKKLFLTLKIIIINKYFLLFSILFCLTILTYFFNTGCLIYPLATSCIDTLSWSISISDVKHMNNWYELWSKAGATPNFRVENTQEYIQYFNWFDGWVERYFFNKVSDFILGLIFLIVIILSIFRKNIYFKNIFKIDNFILFTYIFIIILFFEWLYNHPALRYGGYSIIALLFFIPVSIILETKKISILKINKYLFVLIFLTISIFFIRNIYRIEKEIKVYNYKPLTYSFYILDKNHFRIDEQMRDIIENYNECLINSDKCKLDKKNIVKKFNKIIFINN